MRAVKRVQALKMKNCRFYQGNMDYFNGYFDIGVSLHACGVATDLVIQACIRKKASFVSCPCCYGSVQANHMLSYPRSKRYSSIAFKVSISFWPRAYYAKAVLQIDLLLFREFDTFEKIVDLRRIKMNVPFQLKIKGNGLCYSCCRSWALGPCCPGGLAALTALLP